jgi:23S rRNA G2445 N2-methylase RlmL
VSARSGAPGDSGDSGELFRVTMAAGFESVVRRALEADLVHVEVSEVSSGSILLRAPGTESQALVALPYLSLALRQLVRVDDRSIDAAVVALARQLRRRRPEASPGRAASGRFRLRVSDAGSLVRIDQRARIELENAVSAWSGARPDPRGGGAELWVIRRRDEREVSLSVRLGSATVGKAARGSLKADLAAAFVRTVVCGADDVVVDPFAGSGAIAQARARYPHGRILATDIDRTCVCGLDALRASGRLGRHATVGRLDARDTAGLVNLLGGQQVDAVLTDPPWGQFPGQAADIDRLYRAAFATIDSVLAPAGRVVLLTAAAAVAEQSMHRLGFGLSESFPVLVNGKKASVLVAARQAVGRGAVSSRSGSTA